MKGLFSGLMLLISIYGFAQSRTEKATFKVYGECEMCKQNIEKAASVQGVSAAIWNMDSKVLRIKFSPEVISRDSIHMLIAHAGYDTELYRAEDTIYSSLPKCCKYERKK